MTTSPEQIAANIAASHARKQLHRERQQQIKVVEQQRQAVEAEPYAQYNGKLIGFVVKTRHGRFKAFLGRPINSEGDRDSIVTVIGSQEPQETLEEALAFFAPDLNKFALVLKQPVKSGGMMGHWLAPMLAAQLAETTGTS